jgi:hypothetical protein
VWTPGLPAAPTSAATGGVFTKKAQPDEGCNNSVSPAHRVAMIVFLKGFHGGCF